MISYPQFLLWWIPNRADTKKGSNDKQTKRTNCKKHHARSVADVSGDDNFNIRMGLLAMNEIVETKAKEIIKVDEDYDNKYETMLMLEDWWKEEKHKYRTVALPYTNPGENTTVKIDRYTFQLVYPKDKLTYTIDTDRMKRETIQVVNGETGEVADVNAYDYFCTKPILPKEPYVKVKVEE